MLKSLAEFLGRFPQVVEERGEYGVQCPAHQDTRPSLWFRLKEDGSLLVNCWVCQDRAKVLAALDWSPADLYDWAPGEGVTVSSKPVPEDLSPGHIASLATYVDTTNLAFMGESDEAARARTYVWQRFGLDAEKAADLGLGVDALGVDEAFLHRSPAYQRYPRVTVPLVDFHGVPKGLQGRDLTGDCPARWASLSNPDGAEWAKYGVLRADNTGPVFITEGPGDGLTAVAAGYDAVAIRGATLAGNAVLVEELTAGLGDREVILAGDRDAGGAGFNTALADALTRAGLVVRLLEIPHQGDDLTDWRARDADAFPVELRTTVRRAAVHVVDVATEEPEHVPDLITEIDGPPLPLTDLGNAERLYRQLGGHIRMVPGVGVSKWTGRHWRTIPQEALYADVRAVIQAMPHERGQDPVQLAKHVLESQNASRVKAMVSMLASIPGVYAAADEFDAFPHLLAFRNAVVDLRSGAMREHAPQDMNTYFVNLDYDATAQAPRWERFLAECHPTSPQTPDFLRMLTGYGITGHAVERIFVMHVGETTNGKTTFTDSLENVFREMIKRADPSLFERRRENGGPRADIVGLRGKRLVLSSEWPAGMKLDQALMKSLTGDQSITARGVYARSEITFRPTALVQVDTNYPPDVDATDAALWQRVRVVPWLEDFRGREDRHLKSALAQESAGIAAWAVRGAIEWYAQYKAGKGLTFPAAVEKATARYRDASHPLSGFIEAGGDEFEVVEGEFTTRTEVWERYQTWCEDSGIRHRMTKPRVFAAVRSFPGVAEGAGSGVHRGIRGFRHLRDCRAVKPAPDNTGDIFGQPK
ncbi:DNA primase [Streptomyces natalensis ATCC 27448]|uniref:DNA primase n=1 Tax=Streptomyces natalensis ATCC 27448 TaxID=1240678 RepID=A0A0D7CF37_9ACTN|nr:DNA primase [Streptomyces natalensis ATCC 27448]